MTVFPHIIHGYKKNKLLCNENEYECTVNTKHEFKVNK